MSKSAAPRARAKPPTEDPSIQVLRRFRIVFNAVKTHFRQVEKKAGVGGAQVWALAVVRDHPGIGVSELARAMDIHQSTASNLIRALVEQQLVSVEKAGNDRRAVQLKVLPAGTRVLKKAPAPFTGLLPLALEKLDATTLKRMDRDLAKLIGLLGADSEGAYIPLADDLDR
jgi:DNA-binding MarR family transcriptional regulator